MNENSDEQKLPDHFASWESVKNMLQNDLVNSATVWVREQFPCPNVHAGGDTGLTLNLAEILGDCAQLILTVPSHRALQIQHAHSNVTINLAHLTCVVLKIHWPKCQCTDLK